MAVENIQVVRIRADKATSVRLDRAELLEQLGRTVNRGGDRVRAAGAVDVVALASSHGRSTPIKSRSRSGWVLRLIHGLEPPRPGQLAEATRMTRERSRNGPAPKSNSQSRMSAPASGRQTSSDLVFGEGRAALSCGIRSKLALAPSSVCYLGLFDVSRWHLLFHREARQNVRGHVEILRERRTENERFGRRDPFPARLGGHLAAQRCGAATCRTSRERHRPHA